jgi:REP element-mobilizing transposase RayT
MSRYPRYTPEGGALEVISVRCIQNRYLLRPSQEINQRVVGVLARAQRRTQVKLVAASVLSNHMHLLLWGPDAQQISKFMHSVNSNIPRQVARLQKWSGPFWNERYQPSIVDVEETAQVNQLRYLLTQGCKEGLVASPKDWPGLHASAIVDPEPLQGTWMDHTAYYRAQQNRGSRVKEEDFLLEETLEFSPLPCWADLPKEEYVRRVEELIKGIEEETRRNHIRQGSRPLGRRAVLKRHPHHRPDQAKKSSLPLIHAASKEARLRFLEGFRLFLEVYREASKRLREGELGVRFPEGCFPPAQRFIRFSVQPQAG